MITVGKKGDADKLNELYNKYEAINKKYDAELAALDVLVEEVKQAEEVQAAAIEKFDLQGKLDAVKTEAELAKLREEVEKALSDDTLPAVDGYYKYATELIEAKNIELFSKVDISTLKKGDVVTMKNDKMQDVMIVNVDEKSGVIEIAGKYKTPFEATSISGENTFVKKEDIKYTAHMKQVKTTVTPVEKELIKTSQKSGVELAADQAKAGKALDNADKKTTAQVTEELLNKLGCKK